jgi:hypothetical protein
MLHVLNMRKNVRRDWLAVSALSREQCSMSADSCTLNRRGDLIHVNWALGDYGGQWQYYGSIVHDFNKILHPFNE